MYSRRFGAFLPITSFLASVITTFLIKGRLSSGSETALPRGFWLLVLVTWVAFYFSLYFLNLALLSVFRKQELNSRIEARWIDRLNANLANLKPTKKPGTDYLDHVVGLHVFLSRPSAVCRACARILQGDRNELAALRDANSALLGKQAFSAAVKILANHWRTTAIPISRSASTIDDPVHGSVHLDPMLSTVLAHPMLQRLHRIKQLSFAYAQFPSATHSRLSHCLGAARNAEVALTRILDHGVYYEHGGTKPVPFPQEVLKDREKLVQKAKLIALLHDLGHGPFGHALDGYIGYANVRESTPDPDKLYTHHYITEILAPTLGSLSYDPDHLAMILDPNERFQLKGMDALIGDLIDSPLDVDRMDYLVRDAHATGLTMGFTNTDTLLYHLRAVRVEDAFTLAFDEAALGYMEHFLYAREGMYINCYEHPTKRAAERLFERLVRELVEDASLGVAQGDLYALADEEILAALRIAGGGSKLCQSLLEELTGKLDYVVVHEAPTNARDSRAERWARGAAEGKVGDLKLHYIQMPAQWEESIAAASVGQDSMNRIQVVVPPPSAYTPKFIAARILMYQDGVYTAEEFFKVAPRVGEVLKEMNSARARIKVMCSRDFSPDQRDRIKGAAAKII